MIDSDDNGDDDATSSDDECASGSMNETSVEWFSVFARRAEVGTVYLNEQGVSCSSDYAGQGNDMRNKRFPILFFFFKLIGSSSFIRNFVFSFFYLTDLAN